MLDGLATIYVPAEFTITCTKEEILNYMRTNDVLEIPSSDPNVENCDFYETIDFDDNTRIGKFKIRVLKSVATTKKGDAFGELSLLTNKPRAATIKAKTMTHCATLNRDDYEKIILPIEEKKLNDRINFLRGFPFLQHLSKQTVSKMTYSIKEVEFNRGNTVYHEGEKANGIYLVYNGEFKVYKRLEIKESSTYQRFGTYGKKVVIKDDI